MIKLDYKMQIPPFEFSSFEALTPKQAKEIFQWYVNDIPFRLKQLQTCLDEETGGEIRLTKSKESLGPIWDWFSDTIQTRIRSESELQEEIKAVPEWLYPAIIADNEKLALESSVVGMDIAIYFAEVFIKHHSGINWGYFTKPKSRVSVNEPVLLGFMKGIDMNPRRIVDTLMWQAVKKTGNDGLVETYKIWENFVLDSSQD